MKTDGRGHAAGSDREPGSAPQRGSVTPPLRICPNCGERLADRSCKLVCPNPACGYYLSCSDFL